MKELFELIAGDEVTQSLEKTKNLFEIFSRINTGITWLVLNFVAIILYVRIVLGGNGGFVIYVGGLGLAIVSGMSCWLMLVSLKRMLAPISKRYDKTEEGKLFGIRYQQGYPLVAIGMVALIAFITVIIGTQIASVLAS